MKIEDLPVDFLKHDNSISAFSEDDRFIYSLNRNRIENDARTIVVFDSVYNKCVKLYPDANVNTLFSQIQGFSVYDGSIPQFQIIDNDTLLILFDNLYFQQAEVQNGSTLLALVKLHFSTNSYEIISNYVYNDCYDSQLVKNVNDQFLIVHSFVIDTARYHYGRQFLAYITVSVIGSQIFCQPIQNRVVFDFVIEFTPHGNLRELTFWHVYDNKLWFMKDIQNRIDYQLSYFDLNESRPKEIPIERFNYLESILLQWSGENFIIRYYDESAKFDFFNVDTKIWSKIYYRRNLRKIEGDDDAWGDSLWPFTTSDMCGTSFRFQRYFDSEFNAIVIKKDEKTLIKVPFITPLRLKGIAMSKVLNYGLINELEKRNLKIFPSLF